MNSQSIPLFLAVLSGSLTNLAVAEITAPPMAPATTFEGLVCVGDGYGSNVVTRREDLAPICIAPIADASVSLASGFATTTDPQGRWKLGPIPRAVSDSGQLSVSAPGYSGFSGFSTAEFLTNTTPITEHVWVVFSLPDGSDGWVDLRTSLGEPNRATPPEPGAAASGCTPWIAGGPRLRDFLQQRIDRIDLIDTAGRRWTKRSFLGKVTLIDFWGTWCVGCRVGLPYIDSALSRLDRRGFQALGIALEDTDAKTFKR